MQGKNARQFVCAAALLALLVPVGALAQWESQRTIFTFSDPVTIPGHTLAAGTYEFRIAEGNGGFANPQVIQVFDKNGSKMIATMFAVPALRNDRPKKAEIRFLETPADTPAAIQSWWYPGRTTGHEFVYSHDQALRLAKTTTAGVLTDEGKTRIMPSGEEVKVESGKPVESPVTPKVQVGELPTGEPKVTQASDEEQPVRPPATSPNPRNDQQPTMKTTTPPRQPRPVTTTSPEAPPKDGNEPKEMPHTASSTSSVGALGLVLFCAGLASIAMRANRRRPF